MMMKRILFAICICIAPQIHAERSDKGAGWSKICEGWVGLDINDLIKKWGAPQSEYRMPNGSTIYQWRRASSYDEPPEYRSDGTGGYYPIGGGTLTLECNTQFTTNLDGVITDWKWDGNNC